MGKKFGILGSFIGQRDLDAVSGNEDK